MSDFKTADHVIEVVSYEPPTVYTAQGSNFFFVPAGATHMRVKIWGPGGAGGGGSDNYPGGPGGGGGFIEARDIPVVGGEELLFINPSVPEGGIGSATPGVSGDGGGGGGRISLSNVTTPLVIGYCGGGGGGGGGNDGGLDDEAIGGAGGGGGGEFAQDGESPGGGPTTGGKGATYFAVGLGGNGSLPGDPGSGINGGNGADGSNSPLGANADGGIPGGGNGGSYETNKPGAGGGGGGGFGGGGGGSGTSAPRQGGGGGGGGSNFFFYSMTSNVASDGQTVAGSADPEYPGSSIGSGGDGGVSADGADGFLGAMLVSFGVTTYVNSTNDLVIENDAPVLVDGSDLIAQHVEAILLMCQGEWFLDLGAGTPWFTRVIGQKFSAGQVNVTVRDAILSVTGVASIEDIVSVRDRVNTRNVNVTVKVLTDEGELLEVSAEI
jgi:hypothetical protein